MIRVETGNMMEIVIIMYQFEISIILITNTWNLNLLKKYVRKSIELNFSS